MMLRLLVSLLAAQGASADAWAERVATMSPAELKAEVHTMSLQERGELARQLSPETLIAIGRRRLASLGPYEAVFVSRERVNGAMQAPLTMQVIVREAPFACFLRFLDGPHKNRKVLYNSQLRPKQMRVREGGFLRIFGGFWIDLDSPLARGDTSHSVTDVGISHMLDFVEEDMLLAKPFGGHERIDEGYDERGLWCLKFVAPEKARELTTRQARICIDLEEALPLRVELFDAKGLVGVYEFRNLKFLPSDAPDPLTREATGL